ncbi:MAG TPA: response regulator transcription factor, partial [Blastocatellia bacterium]|nr:response regulator transcription factor [Blastocatellia bacterium]
RVLSNREKQNNEAEDFEAVKIASLTDREREVVTLVCEGLKTKQIAERLFISEKTVSNHLASIYAKLEVADRLDLAIYAYRQRMIRLPQPKPDGQTSLR